ncbi:MAG: RNA polymerase sigma factor [bacterium]
MVPPRSSTPRCDWTNVLRSVSAGDELAFLRLSRLITCFLSDFGAFERRGDWDDVIQDVIMRAIRAEAEGRIRSPSATVAFLRTATRNRLIDYWRRQGREVALEEPEAMEWQQVPVSGVSSGSPLPVEQMDLSRALQALPQDQRAAIVSVYAEGRTYQEAADTTGIPLGSLKRYLRLGLQRLGQSLGAGYPAT